MRKNHPCFSQEFNKKHQTLTQFQYQFLLTLQIDKQIPNSLNVIRKKLPKRIFQLITCFKTVLRNIKINKPVTIIVQMQEDFQAHFIFTYVLQLIRIVFNVQCHVSQNQANCFTFAIRIKSSLRYQRIYLKIIILSSNLAYGQK